MWAPPGLLLAYLSADVAAAPHTSLAKAGGSDVWDNPWRVVLGALDGQGVRLIRGLRPYSKNSLGSHLSTVCTIVSCALPAPGLSLGGTGRFRGAGMARRRRPEMNCSKNSKTRVRPQEDSPRSEAQCTLHSACGPRLYVDHSHDRDHDSQARSVLAHLAIPSERCHLPTRTATSKGRPLVGKQTSGRRQGGRSVLLGNLLFQKGTQTFRGCQPAPRRRSSQAKHECQSSGGIPILFVIDCLIEMSHWIPTLSCLLPMFETYSWTGASVSCLNLQHGDCLHNLVAGPSA